jgi:pimeloyl-ACP methyl ester carboxylesterase
LVPATYAPDRPPARPWSPAQTRIAQAVLGSDFLFWSAIKAMPDTLMRTLLATDPALVAAASAPEQARAKAIMQDILPVSAKSRGLLNDARLAGNPAQMALHQITAPTLAISAEDDLFLTADAARHIADQVPLARLKIYSEGGHIYIGHGDDMLAEIVRFLNDIEYL